jgi:hypothetical protein
MRNLVAWCDNIINTNSTDPFRSCDPYRDNKGNNVCKEKMLEKGNMMVWKKEKKGLGRKSMTLLS